MTRIFDVILSGIAIILLSPFLIPIAVALKLSGEGEIFYQQERVGRNGKSFFLLKFATMLKDSPNIGTGEITIMNDPRILPFGGFLRKSKINELPQLWNIFVGEMSIVGPRPMVPNTFADYSEIAQRTLASVRPGLTGIGSIVFRDEEKLLNDRKDPVAFYKNEIAPYKSDLEIWYVENKSVFLFFKIIFVTAWVVLFPSSRRPEKIFSSIPEMPISLRLENDL